MINYIFAFWRTFVYFCKPLNVKYISTKTKTGNAILFSPTYLFHFFSCFRFWWVPCFYIALTSRVLTFLKIAFSPFWEKNFFSRHILSKNLNWESGVIWKCGPTRLIFAQVLVHSQIIWHCSMTHDPCPCSCPRSWPSYMFNCTWNKQCYAQ